MKFIFSNLSKLAYHKKNPPFKDSAISAPDLHCFTSRITVNVMYIWNNKSVICIVSIMLKKISPRHKAGRPIISKDSFPLSIAFIAFTVQSDS